MGNFERLLGTTFNVEASVTVFAAESAAGRPPGSECPHRRYSATRHALLRAIHHFQVGQLQGTLILKESFTVFTPLNETYNNQTTSGGPSPPANESIFILNNQ